MTTVARPRVGQAGFTLVELLVAAAIMSLVMVSVLGIYQVTQRSTLFATAGEETQSSVRSTIARVATDFRLINAGRPSAAGAVTAATGTSITFLADVDNDTVVGGADATVTTAANTGDTTIQVSTTAGFAVGELLSIADGPVTETKTITAVAGSSITVGTGLSTWYPVGAIVRSVETVTYAWDAGSQALCRNVGGACAAPFPANLVVGDGITGFQLTFLDATGTTITNVSTQANRDLIKEVRLQVTGRQQVGDQTVTRSMQVSVRPRNL